MKEFIVFCGYMLGAILWVYDFKQVRIIDIGTLLMVVSLIVGLENELRTKMNVMKNEIQLTFKLYGGKP